MSGMYSIAAVSAVLKHMLENAIAEQQLVDQIGSGITVSSLPPDRISTADGEEQARLNLFLYHVAPNTSLRGRSGPAGLALDLSYMVSAYGSGELVIELLLGAATQIFYRGQPLDQARIRSALATDRSGENPAPQQQALAQSKIAETMSSIQITPQFQTLEEITRLWSAVQSRYRPSLCFKASVITVDP